MKAAKKAPRLLDQVRNKIRMMHYSIRTEEAYLGWIKRYIYFHGKQHPSLMGANEITDFLTHLSVVGNVSASTQNQALSALVFLYHQVLEIPLPDDMKFTFARKPTKLPVVLTRQEVVEILAAFPEDWSLLGRLLYGTGMRLL